MLQLRNGYSQWRNALNNHLRINSSQGAGTFASENKKRKMISTFKDKANKAGFVTLNINVGEREYCFLIDSGASSNAITKEVYDENDALCEVLSKVTVTGVNGTTNQELLVGMPYQCSNITSGDRFFVITSDVFKNVEEVIGIKLDGILGSPFLFKHQVIIDYAAMELHLTSAE